MFTLIGVKNKEKITKRILLLLLLLSGRVATRIQYVSYHVIILMFKNLESDSQVICTCVNKTWK